MRKGELTVPSLLDGHPVTAIGAEAFSGCAGLVSVVLPDGVTALWDDAFECCAKLTTMTLPKSLRTISRDMTFGCPKLKKIRVAPGDAQRLRELFEAEASADVNIDFEYEER